MPELVALLPACRQGQRLSVLPAGCSLLLPAGCKRALKAVAEEPWVAEVAELTAAYIGPRQPLVLVQVVPVDGTELTAAIRRLRHRLLVVPAIAAVEVTPVDRAN